MTGIWSSKPKNGDSLRCFFINGILGYRVEFSIVLKNIKGPLAPYTKQKCIIIVSYQSISGQSKLAPLNGRAIVIRTLL